MRGDEVMRYSYDIKYENITGNIIWSKSEKKIVFFYLHDMIPKSPNVHQVVLRRLLAKPVPTNRIKNIELNEMTEELETRNILYEISSKTFFKLLLSMYYQIGFAF
jgi:hypothetical protein